MVWLSVMNYAYIYITYINNHSHIFGREKYNNYYNDWKWR